MSAPHVRRRGCARPVLRAGIVEAVLEPLQTRGARGPVHAHEQHAELLLQTRAPRLEQVLSAEIELALLLRQVGKARHTLRRQGMLSVPGVRGPLRVVGVLLL